LLGFNDSGGILCFWRCVGPQPRPSREGLGRQGAATHLELLLDWDGSSWELRIARIAGGEATHGRRGPGCHLPKWHIARTCHQGSFGILPGLLDNNHGRLSQNSSLMMSRCSTTIAAFARFFLSFSLCVLDCVTGSAKLSTSWVTL